MKIKVVFLILLCVFGSFYLYSSFIEVLKEKCQEESIFSLKYLGRWFGEIFGIQQQPLTWWEVEAYCPVLNHHKTIKGLWSASVLIVFSTLTSINIASNDGKLSEISHENYENLDLDLDSDDDMDLDFDDEDFDLD